MDFHQEAVQNTQHAIHSTQLDDLFHACVRYWDVAELCNGVLSGLVAITSASGVVEPWVGIIAGILSAPTFYFVDKLLLKLAIDDVACTVPMHMANGMLGVLLVGFFATEKYVVTYYGATPGITSARWVSAVWWRVPPQRFGV